VKDLNLSTRPFPAHRVIDLLLVSGLIVLVLVSAWQAYGFVHFSTMARAIRDDEQSARVDAEVLRKQVAELESRMDRPESAAKLNEIGFLNGLIARKDLSWTRLFATLEKMVPNSVQLVSLRPDVATNSAIVLHIAVKGRSIVDVSQLVETLERSPIFGKVVVSVEKKSDTDEASDVDVTLTTDYYPAKVEK
jgi:Tfp pilus assembly protein PilN